MRLQIIQLPFHRCQQQASSNIHGNSMNGAVAINHTQEEFFSFNAKNYQSHFRLGSQESCPFVRSHHWPQDTWQNDVTGIFWIMGMIDCDEYPISYYRGLQTIPLAGKQVIWAAPHAMARWFIPLGLLRWEGIISRLTVPSPWQGEVWAIAVDRFPFLSNGQEVLAFFQSNYSQAQIISSVQQSNAVGEKIKKRIDQTYLLPQSDGQISSQLQMGNALITRYFRQLYGLTPVEYRNRKRIYDAVGLLLMTSLSLKEVSQSVGFADFGRFTKNFKKYLNAYPSDLLNYYRKMYSKELPLL